MTTVSRSSAPTAGEEAWEAWGRIVLAFGLAAFEGGWLLMLLLGVIGHQLGDVRWCVGYWACVPAALLARALYGVTTHSTRKYALPPPPDVRR